MPLSAASKFERKLISVFSQNLRTHDFQARRPVTPIGARGETTSSKSQVMTYPYHVGILKHSPPTIYHGQDWAWGSHTGPY